jgi:hypothetical protein
VKVPDNTPGADNTTPSSAPTTRTPETASADAVSSVTAATADVRSNPATTRGDVANTTVAPAADDSTAILDNAERYTSTSFKSSTAAHGVMLFPMNDVTTTSGLKARRSRATCGTQSHGAVPPNTRKATEKSVPNADVNADDVSSAIESPYTSTDTFKSSRSGMAFHRHERDDREQLSISPAGPTAADPDRLRAHRSNSSGATAGAGKSTTRP